MALESFSFINSLNASNPVHATDQVSTGDDHLRGLKTTLLNSFPNINAAVNFTPTEANRLTGLTGLTGTGSLVASISPTFTGTLNAAAVVASSYDGITASNLVDKSASETISGGAWDFQAITAVSFGGIISASLVDKTVTETITGAWTFSEALTVGTITGASGALDFGSTNISTHNDDAQEPGWKGAPQNIQTGAYELLLTDAGKQIYRPSSTGTITIPANGSVAFPIGTIIEVINDTGSAIDVAITTDTLEKFGGASGTQSLGDNHKAVIEKVTATIWKYASTD